MLEPISDEGAQKRWGTPEGGGNRSRARLRTKPGDREAYDRLLEIVQGALLEPGRRRRDNARNRRGPGRGTARLVQRDRVRQIRRKVVPVDKGREVVLLAQGAHDGAMMDRSIDDEPASVYAEITIVGTRTPRRSKKKFNSPSGWGFCGVVAVGGATWSKQLPCSSNVTSSSVLSAFDPVIVTLALTAV